jgi:DNA (cytosine-5)-methyltransferase 1
MSMLENAVSQTHKMAGKTGTDSATPRFTFIDLFAGIGGFRIALESHGGQCVMTSEWDKHAQKTYQAWFGELPFGDIRKIDPKSIPDHDILAAGFPCQPFSIAGVSKKISLGVAHGFKDKKQGNLFFYLADVIKAKRPPVLLLENVKNLKSHDKGNTWRVIKETLEGMGYVVFSEIIDAAHWVPQHRERVFIVGFDKKRFGNKIHFEFPVRPIGKPKLADILEAKPASKYTLTDNLWAYLQNYAKKHREKGNGFGFGMADKNGITRTLSARYHKDGSEILVPQGKKRNPRRLTPKECQRLMGYPTHLPQVVSDTQAYRQFGNGVVVPVVKAVAKEVVDALEQMKPAECRQPKAVSRNVKQNNRVAVAA